MILLECVEDAKNLGAKFKNTAEEIYSFLESRDLMNIPLGKHCIKGDAFYVNVVEYETKSVEKCIWEAHKQYIDVHYVIKGEEVIQINSVLNMHCHDYLEDLDYVKLDGEAAADICLKRPALLFLYPDDAHKTGIAYQSSNLIRKAIFKIKVSE